MVNDLAWLSSYGGPERLAVCYSRLSTYKEGLDARQDHQVIVYENEQRSNTKASRAEVKKICGDPDSENILFGGLDNGRITIWDLRSDKQLPDLISRVSEKTNFLPIIDIKTQGQFLYSLGLDGRFCKWDSRRPEEPFSFIDMFCS